MIRCMTLILNTTCRVRTSDGPAAFQVPVTELQEIEVPNPNPRDQAIPFQFEQTVLHPLGNDYGGTWVHLQPGTKVTVAACYQKTDTWCLAIQEPAGADGKVPPLKGMILRALSFQNVLAAARELGPNGQPLELTTESITPETGDTSTSADVPNIEIPTDPAAAGGDVSLEEPLSVDAPTPAASEMTVEDLLGADA